MKAAIIGFGGMGQTHFFKTKDFNNSVANYKLEIKGIFDIDLTKKKKAEENRLIFYKSFGELLNDKEIEAVIIATPNDSHRYYAEECVKFNKNVICEKPIALNSQEMLEIYSAAEKNNVIFEVHQNRRWDGDFLTLKQIIKDNLIGSPVLIESSVTGCNGIPGDWRKDPAKGGGMMLDWGVHLIDQINLLNLGQLESLYCVYSYFYKEKVEDGFRLFLKYKGGVNAVITVDTNSFKSLSRWRMLCEHGSAEIKDWDINGGITLVKEREDDNLTGIIAGNGYTKTMGNRSDKTILELDLNKISTDAFEFYLNFCKAVEGTEPAHIKKNEVQKVFEIMEAAKISASKNEVIKF